MSKTPDHRRIISASLSINPKSPKKGVDFGEDEPFKGQISLIKFYQDHCNKDFLEFLDKEVRVNN
jgi:hypothetical protein